MEKNIKKYISNVKNIHLLLENINNDILKLNRKLELLKEVNKVRLDQKYILVKNIMKNKVQKGGASVTQNLKMNDELDNKIKNLQDKVSQIREKTSQLQNITKENILKTRDNLANIEILTESVENILGDPEVTKQLTESINSVNFNNANFKKITDVKRDESKEMKLIEVDELSD